MTDQWFGCKLLLLMGKGPESTGLEKLRDYYSGEADNRGRGETRDQIRDVRNPIGALMAKVRDESRLWLSDSSKKE